MLGQQQAPVQIPVDQGGNIPSNEMPNNQPQSQQTMCNNNTPIVTSASSTSAATSSNSNPNSKRNRNSVTDRAKEKEEETDSQFDVRIFLYRGKRLNALNYLIWIQIMNSLDNSKGQTYMNDGNNIPERLDDTG
jgi:hypothetical protein